MKKIAPSLLVQAVLLIVFVFLMIWGLTQAWSWYYFLKNPIIPAGKSLHYIYSANSLSLLANELKQQGYLHHPNKLILLAEFTHSTEKLKSGEYLFKGNITPWQLLKQMIAGKVVQHHFSIIEGWNLSQLLHALDKATYLKHDLKGLNATEIMYLLNNEKSNPEGLFFPATYPYILGDSDLQILKLAYKTMSRKLNKAWENRYESLPYKNSYEALIVASMIEKETHLSQEKPLIAGVIINRIAKHMYLQIDPTVIYALGPHYTGTITMEDLHINSPYNTYKAKGLPPTPIANPSIQSIKAALHPIKTQALFYVATGTGGHIFSKTLKQHDAAIKKYRAYLAALLRKESLPLTRRKNFCAYNKTDLKYHLFCSPCHYLPSNLQFICMAQEQ